MLVDVCCWGWPLHFLRARATPPRACPPHHIRCATPDTGSRIGGSNDWTCFHPCDPLHDTSSVYAISIPNGARRTTRHSYPKFITTCLPLDFGREEARRASAPNSRREFTAIALGAVFNFVVATWKAVQTLFNVATSNLALQPLAEQPVSHTQALKHHQASPTSKVYAAERDAPKRKRTEPKNNTTNKPQINPTDLPATEYSKHTHTHTHYKSQTGKKKCQTNPKKSPPKTCTTTPPSHPSSPV